MSGRVLAVVMNGDPADSGSRATYEFQIAADASFSSIVLSGIENQAAGSTFFVPPADLSAGVFYWRARVAENGTLGSNVVTFTSVSSFEVRTAASYIDPPFQYSPRLGDLVVRPALQFWDGRSGGSPRNLVYDVEISLNPSMSPAAVSLSVSDGIAYSNLTTQAFPPDLSFATTCYWRVKAIDPRTGAASDFSPVWSFKTYGPMAGRALFHMYYACGLAGASFDGTLSDTWTTVRFVAADSENGTSLVLNLPAADGQASGQLQGGGWAKDGRQRIDVRHSPSDAGPAAIHGASGSSGDSQ